MDRSKWTFRLARADELATLVAIDDDACTLYVEAGRDVDLPPEIDPFVIAEHARWRESIEHGRVTMAVDADGAPIGFAALGLVDGEPHLQQVSVRRRAMNRGIGRALVEHAIRWGRGTLWLTTYSDLAWNRPLYEKMGFVCVDEADCGPELRRILVEERGALPVPEARVAMVRRSK
ncbi:MAG TPA: GNAT family N-acetyltransferase [Polyangiaceae bacterium]